MHDQEIQTLIQAEQARQFGAIELIPSENYASQQVRAANGSVLTNKYSEGYPGKRYYGGQENTDKIESLAISRACELFGAKFANVQPHSGSNANIATYMALLQPGDTVLGMDLSHGGHLTHGHPVTKITDFYNFVRYKIGNLETGEIDYDHLRDMAITHKPKIILAGFSAYPRELDYVKFVEIAKEVGAVTMADVSHISGLIAGGAVRNPFDDGFDIMTTTTHKSLRGPRGGVILVRDDQQLAKKIDKAVFPGFQGGPLMHTVAAKAVCFYEALQPDFAKYAQQVIVNAQAMAKQFMAGGIKLVTNGTDNHLLLLDVTSLGITGKIAQQTLEGINITTNMNMIPDDARNAMDPSGLRLGTPAITTRGFTQDAATRLAQLIANVLKHHQNQDTLTKAAADVQDMAKQFAMPDRFM